MHRLVKVVAGLLLIQVALPKFLPLPGISSRWMVVLVGGGVPGVIASLVGGAVLLSYGLALLPPMSWSSWRWGLAAAMVALTSRLLAVIMAAALTGRPLVHYPWNISSSPWTSLAVALTLVALVYGGGTAAAVRMMNRGTVPQEG